MASELFVVAGATGNVGKVVAETLLEHGHTVRAIGRSAEKLAPLVEKGAESAVGDLADPAFLADVLRGAAGAFLMIPPSYTEPDFRAYQRRVGDAFVAAIRESGLKRAVLLSSVGAHLESGTGPIAGLHETEEKLNAIEGLDVFHVRAAFFMENAFRDIPTIKGMGVYGSLANPDVKIPMIATADIGAFVAAILERGDFTGSHAFELLGGGDYTIPQTASILGAAIGKPDLAYVQVPVEPVREAMLGYGMSESAVDGILEMYAGFNNGTLASPVERTPENTTPTKLEDFGATFAAVYNAQ